MQDRTPRQHPYADAASRLAVPLAAPLLLSLLTACAPDHDTNSSRTGPTPPPPSAQSAADSQTEKKLTAQVESALNGFSNEGSSFVESGVERVSDGVHTQPELSPGASYQLIVVCAGSGTAEIEFTPADAGPRKAVPCDVSPVVERLTPRQSKEALRLDVRGKPGATGMMAWRLNKTEPGTS